MTEGSTMGELFGATRRSPVPAYLITGFLGSGKTTLIRELLAQPGLGDTALIINEFGEIGLDQMLVQSAVENVLLMENGCVCCSIRGDLTDTIGDLFAKAATGAMPGFSRILIETTGLADPGPIIRELSSTRGLAGRIALAKVIVTVDALLGEGQLTDAPEAAAQVAHADLILITKCDVADANAVTALAVQLHTLNPATDIARSSAGRVDVARLFAPVAAALPTPTDAPVLLCDGGTDCSHPPGVPCRLHGSVRGQLLAAAAAPHRHHGIESWSLRHAPALGWQRVRDWLDLVYSLRPGNMLRMKAALNLDGLASPLVIHGVGGVIDPPTRLDRWPHGYPVSEIVVITKGLAPNLIGASFEAMVLAPVRGTTPTAGQDGAGAAGIGAGPPRQPPSLPY